MIVAFAAEIQAGGRSKANRTNLRQLPHEVIDRGRRMAAARRFKIEDVLALLRARSEKWQQELALLKKFDKPR
jgi:hypothetical protein